MDFFAPCLPNPKCSNVAVGVLKTASIDGISLAWSDFHPRECRAARVRARALVSGVRARPLADHAMIVILPRRNRCQNSAPPSASFNLSVVQTNDGAEFRTTHVISSSQPVRGSSATFARSSQTKTEDAGARSMSQPLLRPRSDSSQLTGTSSYHQPTGNQSEKISLRSSKEDIENSSFRPQFGGLERRDSKTEDCTDAHAHHTRLGGATSTSEPESVEEPATSNDLPDLPATIPASSPSLSSDDHCRIRSATLPDSSVLLPQHSCGERKYTAKRSCRR